MTSTLRTQKNEGQTLQERLAAATPAPPSASPARLTSESSGGSGVASHGNVKRRVHAEIVAQLGKEMGSNLADAELDRRVREILGQLLEAEATPMSAADKARLTEEIAAEVLGLGPLEPLLRDPSITEIMVNGPYTVYVERDGRLVRAPGVSFFDEAHLRRIADRIVSAIGRRVDESEPRQDARLADGSRVHIIIPPLAIDGTRMTIRKFSNLKFSVEDLVSLGTWTTEAAELMRAVVLARRTVLVSGGTGAGKTSTLNVLSSFIGEHERIVTIEDLAELQLDHDHVNRLEVRPPNVEGEGGFDQGMLLKEALRMRPDRIILGEVRDGTAHDMLQAMNTGHEGSLGTVHANSARDAITRVEELVMQSGINHAPGGIAANISRAIDFIVQQSRLESGVRRITEITEVTGLEGNTVTTQDIFTYNEDTDRLEATGLMPRCAESLRKAGWRGLASDPLAGAVPVRTVGLRR